MPGHIQSIERAAAILRLLSGRTRRLGVVDLAGELALPKGTVHGLLRTLQAVGFVEQDAETGKYQLGAALLHMGSSYLDGNELRARALNWSDSLATRAQEAVRIATLHDSQVLIVHHVFRPDDTLQSLDVGSLLPAHATALGKVLLAHHPYVGASSADESSSRSPTPPSLTTPRLTVSSRACAHGAGAPRSASWFPSRCQSPRPSRIGEGSSWGRLASSVARNGCSRESRAATSWATSSRQAAQSLGSSARSPGEREVAVKERYVAAIDQGTASSRCLIFDAPPASCRWPRRSTSDLSPPGLGGARSRGDLAQRRGRGADARWTSAARASDLVALGIANQRETTVVWDRATGSPVHNAINWQDTRTDHLIRELAARARHGSVPRALRAAAGHLLLGAEAALAARHSARPARARRGGEVLFGTIDTWLIWNLTGRHLTDVTNASRTMLMNLQTLDWDDALLDAMGVPRAMLPEIRPSSEIYGEATASSRGVPVAAALGDQQAALFGQTCFAPARPSAPTAPAASCCSTPATARCISTHGLLTTVGCRIGDEPPTYALEGSIAVTGALVQWFRDNLDLIGSAPEIETLARTVEDNGGCYFVPGVLRPVRPPLAQRCARRHRRPHRLHHQGPPRPCRARGDRLADARGRGGDEPRRRRVD